MDGFMVKAHSFLHIAWPEVGTGYSGETTGLVQGQCRSALSGRGAGILLVRALERQLHLQ